MKDKPEFYKNQVTTEDETLTIPAGCFVSHVHLESDPRPYILVDTEDGGTLASTRVPLPPSLAFFLRVHWSCTDEVRQKIRRGAQNELRERFARLMKIENQV